MQPQQQQKEQEEWKKHCDKRMCEYLDAKIRFGHRFSCKLIRNGRAEKDYEVTLKGEGPEPTGQQLIDLCDGGPHNFGGVTRIIGSGRYAVKVYID